jgi:hypothetical protein
VVFDVVQLLKQSTADNAIAQGHGFFMEYFCGSTDFGVSRLPVGLTMRRNILYYCTERLRRSDGGVSHGLLCNVGRGTGKARLVNVQVLKILSGDPK